MPYLTCHHVHERGVYCASPAVIGQRLCFHHLRQEGRRLRAARARLLRQVVPLDIPPLGESSHVSCRP